jgi:hypothetical protein
LGKSVFRLDHLHTVYGRGNRDDSTDGGAAVMQPTRTARVTTMPGMIAMPRMVAVRGMIAVPGVVAMPGMASVAGVVRGGLGGARTNGRIQRA